MKTPLESNVNILKFDCISVWQETRRWLDLRLEVVNLAVQFFTALFCVLDKDTISPQYAGLVRSSRR